MPARINFYGAHEIGDSQHSSPTTATIIRAPVETARRKIATNREPFADLLRIPG